MKITESVWKIVSNSSKGKKTTVFLFFLQILEKSQSEKGKTISDNEKIIRKWINTNHQKLRALRRKKRNSSNSDKIFQHTPSSWDINHA